MDRNLLIAKIKAQFDKDIQNISTVHTIVELCAIRDGVANCDVISCTDASNMIDIISLEYNLLYIIIVLVKMYL